MFCEQQRALITTHGFIEDGHRAGSTELDHRERPGLPTCTPPGGSWLGSSEPSSRRAAGPTEKDRKANENAPRFRDLRLGQGGGFDDLMPGEGSNDQNLWMALGGVT